MVHENSWQGIGISSNPFQKDEPLSVHLLLNLKKVSESSDNHTLVVANNQTSNYMALSGLDYHEAEHISKKKGKKRRKNLEKICKANSLDNVDAVYISDVLNDNGSVYSKVHNLYNDSDDVKNLVQSIIPPWLKKKTDEHDLLAKYALDEIAAILSFPGVKIGHGREFGYDDLAMKFHDAFEIGIKPEFDHELVGLEYVPSYGRRVEPYSCLVADKRLLLTDSRDEFENKVNSLSNKSKNKLSKSIKDFCDLDVNDGFYDSVVKPTYDEFM